MDAFSTSRFLLSRHAWTWKGLFVGILFFGTAVTTLCTALFPAGYQRILFELVVVLVWCGFWSYNRFIYPKIGKNKLGVLIAIDSENDEQKYRVEADLAMPLEKSLNEGLGSSAFSVVTMSPFHATRASKVLYEIAIAINSAKKNPTKIALEELAEKNERWQKLHKRCNATIYIYGNIKERKDVKDSYFFSIDTLVVHRPINAHTKGLFQRDVAKSFPRKASFYKEIEFSGFELTTRSLFVAIGFISGIVTLIAGDYKSAMSMLTALKAGINSLQAGPENVGYIKSRINSVLASCLLTEYMRQIQEHGVKALVVLDRAYELEPTDYAVIMHKAYAEFAYKRDTGKTLHYLEVARQHSANDLMWLYNKAFVYLYIGKYKKAADLYKELESASCLGEQEIVDECIKNDLTLVQAEQTRTQLLFALGFLYAKKNDAANSKKYYLEFIDRCKNNAQLTPLLTKARKKL